MLKNKMFNIINFIKSGKGLTLSELMIAALILVFALVGLLTLFITCLFLNENSRNSTLAYSAMEMRMEELSNENYLSLDSLNNEILPLNGFSAGRGVYELTVINDPDGVSGDLKRIAIKACYMNRNMLVGTVTGYVPGGVIDNCQASPVELITSIAQP